MSGLHHSQSAIVRISAVRAIYGFCVHLKTTNNFKTVTPFVGEMIEGLVTIATQFSCEVLALCMETLCVVLEVGDLTGVEGTQLSNVCLQTLSAYSVIFEKVQNVTDSELYSQVFSLSTAPSLEERMFVLNVSGG